MGQKQCIEHGIETYADTFSYNCRAVSAALVPITILPFAAGSLNPLLDGTLIGLTLIHTYIGFQYASITTHPHRHVLIRFRSVIIDYIPSWRMKGVRKLFEWANVLALFVVGWGYYEFETNDVGLTEAIKRIWRAGSKPQDVAK